MQSLEINTWKSSYNFIVLHQIEFFYCYKTFFYLLQAKVPSTVKNTTRYIPQAPDRILDAPDILDDYCELQICIF